MHKEKLYTIRDAASASDCSVTKLRNIDPIVQPLKTQSGQRIYTQQHVDIARVVLHPKK